MRKKNLLVVSIIFVFGLMTWGLIAITSNDNKKANDDGLKIATTIFPLADMAKNVVGENVEVVQVLPSGSSPHTFEGTIQQQLEIEGADVLFYIGQGLDDWALELVGEDTMLVDLSKIVELEKSDHHDEDSHEHDEEDEDMHDEDSDGHIGEDVHEHGEYDPHYWLSVTNAIKISEEIAAVMGEYDSDNTDMYQTNLEGYVPELENLRDESRARLDSLADKNIITFHESFEYFADDLGLVIIATVEEFPGKEPSAAYLAEIGEIITENNEGVIYKEPQLSDSIISALADDYGVSVYTLDPLGGIDERQSYIDLIEYNVNTIIEANASE